MTNHRIATDAELLAHLDWDLTRKNRISFRHFIKEVYAPARRNGVRHIDHSRRVPFVRDGQVFVHHQGHDQKLTASLVTLENGKSCLYDVRLDSEYLKPFHL